jgi:hypothetical protein
MSLLQEAVKLASEPLVTNQIEVHPFIDQDKVLAACRTLGLSVTAYCPLARGKVPGNDMLARLSRASHGQAEVRLGSISSRLSPARQQHCFPGPCLHRPQGAQQDCLLRSSLALAFFDLDLLLLLRDLRWLW